MPLLEWSESLALGQSVMDETHREFVSLLNRLGAAGDAELLACLDEFIAHTEAHFGRNEAWMEAMQKDSGEKLSELRVDGGAAANDLLVQFQADLLGVPVIRPKVLETTALGAAYLAGLTVNLWDSRDEAAKQWRAERRFEPRMSRAEGAEKLARWREAVSRSRNWAGR